MLDSTRQMITNFYFEDFQLIDKVKLSQARMKEFQS
tara:strand:- start:37036 stop:37143 length:108 start_codon:yes stop_codon:yes gene_type:complete